MLAGAIPSFLPYPTSSRIRVSIGVPTRNCSSGSAPAPCSPTTKISGLARKHYVPPSAPADLRAGGKYPGRFCAPRRHSRGDCTPAAQLRHHRPEKRSGALPPGRAAPSGELRQVLKITPDDCIVSWLPLYHDMGLIACFLLPLITNIPVVMVDPFEWVVNPTMFSTRSGAPWHALLAAQFCVSPPVPHGAALAQSGPVVRPRPGSTVRNRVAPRLFELFARTFARAGVKPEKTPGLLCDG